MWDTPERDMPRKDEPRKDLPMRDIPKWSIPKRTVSMRPVPVRGDPVTGMPMNGARPDPMAALWLRRFTAPVSGMRCDLPSRRLCRVSERLASRP